MAANLAQVAPFGGQQLLLIGQSTSYPFFERPAASDGSGKSARSRSGKSAVSPKGDEA
jgi:hypothetical protein